jgi:hypothetical protein
LSRRSAAKAEAQRRRKPWHLGTGQTRNIHICFSLHFSIEVVFPSKARNLHLLCRVPPACRAEAQRRRKPWPLRTGQTRNIHICFSLQFPIEVVIPSKARNLHLLLPLPACPRLVAPKRNEGGSPGLWGPGKNAQSPRKPTLVDIPTLKHTFSQNLCPKLCQKPALAHRILHPNPRLNLNAYIE